MWGDEMEREIRIALTVVVYAILVGIYVLMAEATKRNPPAGKVESDA